MSGHEGFFCLNILEVNELTSMGTENLTLSPYNPFFLFSFLLRKYRKPPQSPEKQISIFQSLHHFSSLILSKNDIQDLDSYCGVNAPPSEPGISNSP